MGFMPVSCLFYARFMPAVASQQFLKGAAPSWDDGTPYYTGPNPRDVEAKHQVFIRAASKLLKEWPRSHGLRAVATNFQVWMCWCISTATQEALPRH